MDLLDSEKNTKNYTSTYNIKITGINHYFVPHNFVNNDFNIQVESIAETLLATC